MHIVACCWVSSVNSQRVFHCQPLNLKSKSLSLVKKPNSVNILICLSFLSPLKLSAEEKIHHCDKFARGAAKIFLIPIFSKSPLSNHKKKSRFASFNLSAVGTLSASLLFFCYSIVSVRNFLNRDQIVHGNSI